MFIGALIHEFTKFKIPYAGGCKLGTRTIRASSLCHGRIRSKYRCQQLATTTLM